MSLSHLYPKQHTPTNTAPCAANSLLAVSTNPHKMHSLRFIVFIFQFRPTYSSFSGHYLVSVSYRTFFIFTFLETSSRSILFKLHQSRPVCGVHGFKTLMITHTHAHTPAFVRNPSHPALIFPSLPSPDPPNGLPSSLGAHDVMEK